MKLGSRESHYAPAKPLFTVNLRPGIGWPLWPGQAVDVAAAGGTTGTARG